MTFWKAARHEALFGGARMVLSDRSSQAQCSVLTDQLGMQNHISEVFLRERPHSYALHAKPLGQRCCISKPLNVRNASDIESSRFVVRRRRASFVQLNADLTGMDQKWIGGCGIRSAALSSL
jgi:hypothetical protein